MWLLEKIKIIGERLIGRKSENCRITEDDILKYLEEERTNTSNSSEKSAFLITEEDILDYLKKERMDNSRNIKEGIQQDENRQLISKSNKEKNYAISDIHGMYGSYIEAVQSLNKNDNLYVIGDVVDRGENGIKILLDMMTRQNVKFILGNHEWQMIQILDLIKKYNLSVQEIVSYCRVGEVLYWENENGRIYIENRNDSNKNVAEELRKQKEEYLNKIGNVQLNQYDIMLMYIWIMENHGDSTLADYLSLTKQQQDELYKYLTNSYIMMQKTVGEQKICLVHASPPPDVENLIKLFEEDQKEGIKYSDIAERNSESMTSAFLHYCTETRNKNDGFIFWKEHGYKTIYGHTPQRRGVLVNENKNSVCIDTACSMGGNLALYCLNNGNVRYIEPKEDYIEKQNDYR